MLEADGSALVLGVLDVAAKLTVYPGTDPRAFADDTDLVPCLGFEKSSRPVDEIIDLGLLVDGVHPAHPDVENSTAPDV